MSSSDLIKVLFLASDPSDAVRLRLGQELREIREKLQMAKQRDKFSLESRESVRPGDITQSIFDVEPQIVHFSGHGMSTGELCFEDILGKTQPVQPNALTSLFELVAGQVKCVVLNACYSEIQARAISQHIDYVIGMHDAIGDKAATSFSIGFYKALGAGYSIEEAYKFGLVEIKLSSIPEHLVPALVKREDIQNTQTETIVSDDLFPSLAAANSLSKVDITVNSLGLLGTVFKDFREARSIMKADCQIAETIAVMSNRGLNTFGIDQSLISLAEIEKFKRLRKLRIILLGSESKWLNSGFIKLRTYESIEIFKKELKACHDIIESAMARLSRMLGHTKSGIRYHHGEPKFGMLITDKVAYVNSYAESPATQVIDLPIYRFERKSGSLYSAFKRHFDDIWHNQSVPGEYIKENIDLETSAGGIIIAEQDGHKFVVLLRRHDGYWVLPKGHRMISDKGLEETARREVVEETGLQSDDFYIEKSLGYYTYDETAEKFNSAKIIHLFLMRCKQGAKPELIPTDFVEAKWWPINAPLPEMLYIYQKSYLHEIIQVELKT